MACAMTVILQYFTIVIHSCPFRNFRKKTISKKCVNYAEMFVVRCSENYTYDVCSINNFFLKQDGPHQQYIYISQLTGATWRQYIQTYFITMNDVAM